MRDNEVLVEIVGKKVHGLKNRKNKLVIGVSENQMETIKQLLSDEYEFNKRMPIDTLMNMIECQYCNHKQFNHLVTTLFTNGVTDALSNIFSVFDVHRDKYANTKTIEKISRDFVEFARNLHATNGDTINGLFVNCNSFDEILEKRLIELVEYFTAELRRYDQGYSVLTPELYDVYSDVLLQTNEICEQSKFEGNSFKLEALYTYMLANWDVLSRISIAFDILIDVERYSENKGTAQDRICLCDLMANSDEF